MTDYHSVYEQIKANEVLYSEIKKLLNVHGQFSAETVCRALIFGATTELYQRSPHMITAYKHVLAALEQAEGVCRAGTKFKRGRMNATKMDNWLNTYIENVKKVPQKFLPNAEVLKC